MAMLIARGYPGHRPDDGIRAHRGRNGPAFL